jgi:hypothetical protein
MNSVKEIIKVLDLVSHATQFYPLPVVWNFKTHRFETRSSKSLTITYLFTLANLLLILGSLEVIWKKLRYQNTNANDNTLFLVNVGILLLSGSLFVLIVTCTFLYHKMEASQAMDEMLKLQAAVFDKGTLNRLKTYDKTLILTIVT